MREPLEKCYWQARDFAKRQQMVDADFLEKYAELIVGECVNMIEAAAENADDEDVHGMRNAAGLISRAFITFHNADLKNELANR